MAFGYAAWRPVSRRSAGTRGSRAATAPRGMTYHGAKGSGWPREVVLDDNVPGGPSMKPYADRSFTGRVRAAVIGALLAGSLAAVSAPAIADAASDAKAAAAAAAAASAANA